MFFYGNNLCNLSRTITIIKSMYPVANMFISTHNIHELKVIQPHFFRSYYSTTNYLLLEIILQLPLLIRRHHPATSFSYQKTLSYIFLYLSGDTFVQLPPPLIKRHCWIHLPPPLYQESLSYNFLLLSDTILHFPSLITILHLSASLTRRHYPTKFPPFLIRRHIPTSSSSYQETLSYFLLLLSEDTILQQTPNLRSTYDT